MRGDFPIQKNREIKTRTKIILVVFACLMLTISACFPLFAARAYFTASSSRAGELKFGSIEIKLTDIDNNSVSGTFLGELMTDVAFPGTEYDFSNELKIVNTGSSAAWVLLNLEITIDSPLENYDLYYSRWYDLEGNEICCSNFKNNTTTPTKIEKDETKIVGNLSFKLSEKIIDNKYLHAPINYNALHAKLTAYATQTRLPLDNKYKEGLYASYFIVSNAHNFVNVSENKTIYYGDPLETGETASGSGAVQAETVTVADNQAKYTLSAEELEKFKDKNFVVSCEVKNLEDDDSTYNGTDKGFKMTMEYVFNDQSIEPKSCSSGFKYWGGNKYNNKFYHNWISNERILSKVSDFSSIKEINIYLADYQTATKRNFEVRNLRIEIGVSPTDFVA